MHLTTNGGKTWSARTLDGPWPIRQLIFVTSKIGWAAGGNIYSDVGGIYFTSDGGQTWSLDVNTGAQMDACHERALKVAIRSGARDTMRHSNGVIYSAVTPSYSPITLTRRWPVSFCEGLH